MAQLKKATAMSCVGCKVKYVIDESAETTEEMLVVGFDSVVKQNIVKWLGKPEVQFCDVPRLLKKKPFAHVHNCAFDDPLFLEYTKETANEKKSRPAAVDAAQKIERDVERDALPEEEIEDVGPPARKRHCARRHVSISINVNGAALAEEYLQCPIGREVMKDPVVAGDGHTYERTNIQGWLANRGRHATSPMTGAPLKHGLTPNHYPTTFSSRSSPVGRRDREGNWCVICSHLRRDA